MRRTTCMCVYVCDVTLPGVDKADNLPIGITETLHMPRIIMVYNGCYPPLEKKWSREIAMSVPELCGW